MTDTLAAPASFEETIQKSRFRARAWPIVHPNDALAHIAECAREPASHHCWAYRAEQAYRFHDADEPAGTAGRPILQAIDGQGYDRVVVVVSRWFGGIKLGAGGLVRAYGGCAAECLRRASRRDLITQARLDIEVPFACENTLRQLMGECAAHLHGEQYSASGLCAQVEMPVAAIERFSARLRDISRGQARVRHVSAGPAPSDPTPTGT